jgi:sec-independent protein translocase protein TatA
MGSLGVPELIIIFFVVLLVFGAKRIPEIARGLGQGIRQFKDATSDIKRELDVEDTRSAAPQRRVEPPREAPLPQYQAPQQQPVSRPDPYARPAVEPDAYAPRPQEPPPATPQEPPSYRPDVEGPRPG